MTNKSSRAEAFRKNRNKNGRPKSAVTEKKGYKVTVKFATAEYYSLKAKTKEAGMTISHFVREALQQCEVKQRLSDIHLSYIRQLTGMANNLNQIAHKANAEGYASARTASEALATRVDNVIKLIENDG